MARSINGIAPWLPPIGDAWRSAISMHSCTDEQSACFCCKPAEAELPELRAKMAWIEVSSSGGSSHQEQGVLGRWTGSFLGATS
jgi:hypothetical protein